MQYPSTLRAPSDDARRFFHVQHTIFGRFAGLLAATGNAPDIRTVLPRKKTPNRENRRFARYILGGPGRNRTTDTRWRPARRAR